VRVRVKVFNVEWERVTRFMTFSWDENKKMFL